MRIGVLVASIGAFGQKGFYNTQEIGLAKALAGHFEDILIYKLVAEDQTAQSETVDGCERAVLHTIPSRQIGNNGLFDLSVLDTSIDALIFFSDTQLIVPSVYRWAKKNNIPMYPYIGVTESHSTSVVKRIVMDVLFARNIRVYRKCHCFVKTPAVRKQLESMGVERITVAPVGLDTSLLREDSANYSAEELKGKYGCSDAEKVILFIGRLIDEKQPVRMIDIFAGILRYDENYRLSMGGTGELRGAVTE